MSYKTLPAVTATTTRGLVLTLESSFQEESSRNIIVYNTGSSVAYVGDENVTVSTGIPIAVDGAVTFDSWDKIKLYALTVSGTAGLRVAVIV